MSWENLTSDIAEMFAELSGAQFDAQALVCWEHERTYDAQRDRSARNHQKRWQYRTDPGFAEKLKAESRVYRKANLTKVRARSRLAYADLCARGICTACKDRPALLGRKQCAECREKTNVYERQRIARVRQAGGTIGGPYRCGACGELGHNRRGCKAVTA